MWWLTIDGNEWMFPGLKECVESETFRNRATGCDYRIEWRVESSSHGTEWSFS